uniref:Uncharacterized protein n=1 Tax=Phage sp. ctSLR2 TaxID=2825796 RepID=A0A8S5QEY9_9VIRU|nr:MAG TPA: hypothetical protein [Phage sp. ctSLR2]
MIEKIKITDASVIEDIRDNLPTATRQAKGLMPVISESNPYWRYIELGDGLSEEFDFGYGQVSIWSSQRAFSSLILLGVNSVKIVSEEGYYSLSTVKEKEGSVNVYKTAEYKFIVQNKSGGIFRFYISYR